MKIIQYKNGDYAVKRWSFLTGNSYMDLNTTIFYCFPMDECRGTMKKCENAIKKYNNIELKYQEV